MTAARPLSLNALSDTPGVARTLLDLDLALDARGLPTCFFGLAPEPQRDGRRADSQSAQRHAGKPRWKQRINVQPSVWRVGLQAENGLQQMKHGSGCPGLRDVRAEIQHRKCPGPALEARIEFRQAIADEVARRF